MQLGKTHAVLYSIAEVTVTVISSDLVVSIDGGLERDVSSLDALALDASASVDPVGVATSTMTWQWSCAVVDSSGVASACTFAIQNPTNAKMMVTGGTMPVSASGSHYAFSCSVKKAMPGVGDPLRSCVPMRTTTKSVKITVKAGDVPVVKVAELQNRYGERVTKVNPTGKVILRGVAYFFRSPEVKPSLQWTYTGELV